MPGSSFLIQGFVLDAHGGARRLDSDALPRWTPDQGVLYAVLDRHDAATEAWLRQAAGLPELVVDSILLDETRPRCAAHNGGLMIVLRAVNVIPGAEPDDMLTLRGWFEERRVLLVRGRPVAALEDVAASLRDGSGPSRAAEVLVQLLDAISDRIGDSTGDLSEQADSIEAGCEQEDLQRSLRVRIAELRSQCMTMRRHIAPQRDMVGRMMVERTPLLTDHDRAHLREAAEHLTHAVEELDLIRERLVIAQEQLAARINEKLSRNTYTLSVVASVFLPLTLLTGLLGINVGGIPLADSPWGFLTVCLLLGVLVPFEIWLFKRMRWM